MAAIYRNMIKELILQSKLNGQLLNEVNNKFDNNDTNLEDVKNNHMNRVNEVYRRLGYNYIYPYFDGTNLVNSLFSCIVVPLEYLKGRYNNSYRRIDRLFEERNPKAYQRCLNIINSLYNNGKVVDTYNQTFTNNVYGFFGHLRDALSHSGNGQIHFFPNNDGGRDITHLYFYDEKKTRVIGRDYAEVEKVFIAKIHILEELVPLVDAFDEIIISIVDNNLPYNLEYVEEQVRRLANRNIPR